MATTLSLVTVFTPATTCLQSVFTLSPSGSDVYQSGTVTRGIESQCYPSGFRALYEGSTITGSAFIFIDGSSSSTGYETTTYQSFYSPGICPSGYTTATASWNMSTVFATCCPSVYSLGASSATSQMCTHTILGDYMTLIGEISNQTLPYPATAVAAPILIAYDANDQAIQATATDTESYTTLASPGSTAGNATPSASSATPSHNPSDHHLSSGARIGIGVGIAVGIVIAACVVFVWFRHRSNPVRPAQEEPIRGGDEFSGKPELEANSARHEAPDTAVMPHEMDAKTIRAEISGHYEGAQIPGHDLSADHRHEAPA